MGDWRDSVRSQQSEKTDAVRVCRKTGGWKLCFGPDATLNGLRKKCYCPLTRARQWVTACTEFFFVDEFSERRLTKYTGQSTRKSPQAGVGRERAGRNRHKPSLDFLNCDNYAH